MYLKQCLQLLCACAALVLAEKCNQTPRLASKYSTASLNEIFNMTVQNKGADPEGLYMPDQRYVISLFTTNSSRLFRWFMVTIEQPEVDSSSYEFDQKSGAVGNLKTLDGDRKSRYSVQCRNSVENIDNSEKERIEMHWLSPKPFDGPAKNVRIRAMVAENADLWYTSPNLTVVLVRDDRKPIDSPKYDPQQKCSLCSEARYEVIFQGQWSRLTHPQNFPTNLDNNKYSYMVGASHDYEFVLWKLGTKATEGLKSAAETADTTKLENEIIEAMRGNIKNSTRTLIRGRRTNQPNMFLPSQALFRVDPRHHLFSVVIAFQPSPDWFLGAHQFELCNDMGWLYNFTLPLYPWDAGTMDGVSYEGQTKMTTPPDNVDRVALGSFDRESPFYQINLNDLKAFGHLHINLLDVYPLPSESSYCTETDDKSENEEEAANQEEEPEEPLVLESHAACGFGEWSDWSPCVPDADCGLGRQFRTRLRTNFNPYRKDSKNPGSSGGVCIEDPDSVDTEYKDCYVDCY